MGMAERGDLSSQISRKSYFSRFLGQKGVETPLLEVTRREAPFELPWADWDDLRLSGRWWYGDFGMIKWG